MKGLILVCTLCLLVSGCTYSGARSVGGAFNALGSRGGPESVLGALTLCLILIFMSTRKSRM